MLGWRHLARLGRHHHPWLAIRPAPTSGKPPSRPFFRELSSCDSSSHHRRAAAAAVAPLLLRRHHGSSIGKQRRFRTMPWQPPTAAQPLLLRLHLTTAAGASAPQEEAKEDEVLQPQWLENSSVEELSERLVTLVAAQQPIPQVELLVKKVDSLFLQSKDIRPLLSPLVNMLCQMNQCTPFVCLVLIRILGKLCRHTEALQLITCMTQQGYLPDVSLLSALIEAVGRNGDIHKAHYFFNEIERLGMRHTIASYNALIDALMRADHMDKVEQCFQDMKKNGINLNKRTYSLIIRYNCNTGRLDDAFEQFLKMKQNGFEANPIIYSTLIFSLSMAGDHRRAKLLQEEMEHLGLETSATNYTRILSELSSSPQPPDVKNLISRLERGDISQSSFDELLGKFSDRIASSQAFIVARAITENKIESTTSLWQVLLRICCRKRKSAQMGVKLLDIMWQHSPHLVTIRTYCVIADTLAKSGSINQAMELLHNMRSHNIEPNEAIFNVFIDGTSRMPDGYKKTLQVFKLMKDLGVPPSNKTYNILIDAAGFARKPQEAEAFFNEMQEAPHYIQPTTNCYNSLIEALARNGQLSQAEKVLDSMMLTRVVGKLKTEEEIRANPTTKTFGTLLAFCLRRNDLARATRVVNKMKLFGVPVTALAKKMLQNFQRMKKAKREQREKKRQQPVPTNISP